MALLRSVDNIPGIDTLEYRDKLYFNKYSYKVHFRLELANKVNYLTSEDEYDSLFTRTAYHYRVPNEKKQLLKTNKQQLLEFLRFKLKNAGMGKPMTVRVEGSGVSAFSNELNLLRDFVDAVNSAGAPVDAEFIEAKASPYAGVKYFAKEPKYAYRAYLRGGNISESDAKELQEFLQRHAKSLHPSASFRRWLSNPRSQWTWSRTPYITGNYCIEYDDENLVSLLMLTHGNLIGHRYKLEKRPEL